jgi:hypothetical protein
MDNGMEGICRQTFKKFEKKKKIKKEKEVIALHKRRVVALSWCSHW